MTRDTDTIPYRRTQAYARAVVAAALQRAAVRHHRAELWPSQRGQSTSGVMRRPWYGHAGPR
jgi:hypothetical protein